MDFTELITEVVKVSPFAGVLLFFLRTVWNNLQKKDDALTTAMKEHNTAMLQNQRENITAINNSADASRQLSGSLDQLRQHLCDSNEEVLQEVRSLKNVKLNVRRPAGEPKSATA
jgi:uncharacterized membrane-anchored protein YhcB (DUF1043 family)